MKPKSRLFSAAVKLLSPQQNFPGSRHATGSPEKTAPGFMSRTTKKWMGMVKCVELGVLCFLVVLVSGRVSYADITINGYEVGNDVVFEYAGSVNTSGFGAPGDYFGSNIEIETNDDGFGARFNNIPAGSSWYFKGVVPRFSLGVGDFLDSYPTKADQNTGDPFGLVGQNLNLFLPENYVSETELSGTLTFSDNDLVSLLGAAPTDFSFSLNLGGGDVFWVFAPPGDELWLTQALTSGIPMNQAIGQVASSIHTTGLRDFSSRLFRGRSRWVPLDDDTLAVNSRSWSFRGREVSASRFTSLGREKAVSHTINLGGVAHDSSAGATAIGELDAPVIDDSQPFLSVTRPAGCSVDPGFLALGSNWMLFGAANFGQLELDSLGGNPALDSDTQASTLGFEYHFNEHLALGAGWTHTWNETDFAQNLGGADIEGDAAVIYASYFKRNLWADLMYSYGNYEADIHRNTATGTARANPDIDTHQVAFNLGYNLGHDGGRIVHGPAFAATWTGGSLDGYTETGAGTANTTFAEQEFDSLITTAGWQFNTCLETNYGVMRPQFRVGYGHEHLDQDQTIQATSPTLAVPTLTRNQHDPGHGWLDLGSGVSWQLRDNVSLLLDYNGQFLREDVGAAHHGTIRAKIGF